MAKCWRQRRRGPWRLLDREEGGAHTCRGPLERGGFAGQGRVERLEVERLEAGAGASVAGGWRGGGPSHSAEDSAPNKHDRPPKASSGRRRLSPAN